MNDLDADQINNAKGRLQIFLHRGLYRPISVALSTKSPTNGLVCCASTRKLCNVLVPGQFRRNLPGCPREKSRSAAFSCGSQSTRWGFSQKHIKAVKDAVEETDDYFDGLCLSDFGFLQSVVGAGPPY